MKEEFREPRNGVHTSEKRQDTWTGIHGKVTDIEIWHEDPDKCKIKFTRVRTDDYYTNVTIAWPEKNRPLPGKPFAHIDDQYYWVTNFEVFPGGILGQLIDYFKD